MNETLEALSESRRSILSFIKSSGGCTTAEVATHLGITDEGARQHLVYLESHGWITRGTRRPPKRRSGRPTAVYEISPSGDEFFPKRYDDLSVALIETVVSKYGVDALKDALATMTDRQVEAWAPRLRGKTLEERLELLRDYYLKDDPFTTVQRNGHVALVERNCPFRNVALAQPLLCSMTVSTLTRLLGVRVERKEKLQNGDGCCAFFVYPDEPVDADDFRFEFEDSGD